MSYFHPLYLLQLHPIIGRVYKGGRGTNRARHQLTTRSSLTFRDENPTTGAGGIHSHVQYRTSIGSNNGVERLKWRTDFQVNPGTPSECTVVHSHFWRSAPAPMAAARRIDT